MKKLAFLASMLLAVGGVSGVSSEVAQDVGGRGVVGPRATVLAQPVDECSPRREVFEIREADPAVDQGHHDLMRDTFIEKAKQPNTTILLGPNVVLDFSKIEALPIELGRCVTIGSVTRFAIPPPEVAVPPGGGVILRSTPGAPQTRAGAVARLRSGVRGVAGIGVADRPTTSASRASASTVRRVL